MGDESPAALCDKIRAKRAEQDRMPAHWVDRRAELGDEIDDLVDLYLARLDG